MAEAEGFVDGGRSVIRVEGPEARGWLQDLVTCDVGRVAPGRAAYGALLNPQGKYLFDFLIFAAPEPEDALLLDVAAERAPDLLRRLSLYRVRRKVALTEVGLGVAVVWGAEPAAPAEGAAAADPRSPKLGWRVLAAEPETVLAAAGARPVGRERWDAVRVAEGVPETGVELVPEDTYILEAGFDRLGGVDFRKGCYVGQEVTARMRHKTELRKGLVRVTVEGEAPPPGAELLTEAGKVAGTLFTVSGGEGLAHLRFDRSGGPLRAGGAVVRRLEA